MKLSILVPYYKNLVLRNSKLNFYFITTFIIFLVVLLMYIFLQKQQWNNFYIHKLLIFSYLFNFFYNHLYYGLGWESSFRHFVVFHFKIKNIIYMYVFLNIVYSIFSFVIIKLLSVSGWLVLDFGNINILVIYIIFPNTLFLLIFPLLTIYVNLFNNERGFVIHKFYGFPLLILTIAMPSALQYIWLNTEYGAEIVSLLTILLVLFVIMKFQKIIKMWEGSLLNLKID